MLKKKLELILISNLLLNPISSLGQTWEDFFLHSNPKKIKKKYFEFDDENKNMYNNTYLLTFKKISPFHNDLIKLCSPKYLNKIDKIKYFQKNLNRFKKRKCGNKTCIDYIYEKASQIGIDPDLAFSIAYTETHLKHKYIKSKQGAIGLFQILPSTGKLECNLNKNRLWVLKDNIDCGLKYIKKIYLLKNVDSFEDIASAYQGGPNYVKKNSNQITREKLKYKRPNNYNYVKKVMKVFYTIKKKRF